jgi:hypothetical protein
VGEEGGILTSKIAAEGSLSSRPDRLPAVPLSDVVHSKEAVDKAGEIVRSVKEVKSLKNNLILK